MRSKVSIIVPCYNQGHLLNDALQSVLDQSYSNWECIIVNDGSTDNTEEVSYEWVKKDQRFQYLLQKNEGVSNARNSGIKHSYGKFILPLDADDKISPDYIKLAIDEFEANSTLKLVYCEAKRFGDEDVIWKLEKFSLENLAKKNMIFCSAIYKKSDWEKAGGYDIEMVTGFEDWEFWISVLKNGGKVIQLDYIGFFYRINETSRTKKINQSARDALFNYMSIKHADFFVEQIGSFFSLRNIIA